MTTDHLDLDALEEDFQHVLGWGDKGDALGGWAAEHVPTLLALAREALQSRAEIADLKVVRNEAISLMSQYARESGEAKGRLEASELAGVVGDWQEKCAAQSVLLAECLAVLRPFANLSEAVLDADGVTKLPGLVAESRVHRITEPQFLAVITLFVKLTKIMEA